jgi:hypothetical protein
MVAVEPMLPNNHRRVIGHRPPVLLHRRIVRLALCSTGSPNHAHILAHILVMNLDS